MIAAVRGVTAAAAAARIEREAIGIDVGEHRPRAGHHDRQRRVRGRQRRGDDLVARTDAERAQRDRQRVGAGADADGVRRAAGCRELALERLELGTEHEPAALHDPGDRGSHERRVLARRERQERDHRRTACGGVRLVDVVGQVRAVEVDRPPQPLAQADLRAASRRRVRNLRRVGVEAADVDALLLGRPLDVADSTADPAISTSSETRSRWLIG